MQCPKINIQLTNILELVLVLIVFCIVAPIAVCILFIISFCWIVAIVFEVCKDIYMKVIHGDDFVTGQYKDKRFNLPRL